MASSSVGTGGLIGQLTTHAVSGATIQIAEAKTSKKFLKQHEVVERSSCSSLEPEKERRCQIAKDWYGAGLAVAAPPLSRYNSRLRLSNPTHHYNHGIDSAQ